MNIQKRLEKLEAKTSSTNICDCPETQRIFVRFPGKEHYEAVPPPTCEKCAAYIDNQIIEIEFTEELV